MLNTGQNNLKLKILINHETKYGKLKIRIKKNDDPKHD